MLLVLLVAVTIGWLGCAERSPAAADGKASGPSSASPVVRPAASAAAAKGARMRVNLPKTFDNGTFARFALGSDEVVVRRGRETGFAYGTPVARRPVTVQGLACEIVTYETLLSPPPADGRRAPVDPATYRPSYDVLYAAGEELLVPHRDGLVERLLAAITIES